MLFGGVRLEACEVVEEAKCLRVESSGCGGDHRHEPVVLGLKPLVVLGHLGTVGPVERVFVGVCHTPPADGVHNSEVKRRPSCAPSASGKLPP